MRRALVIDDDVCVHDLAALALGGHGWQVLTAGSGEDAIQSAVDSQPDVILLDLHMQPLDGRAILARLRNQNETSGIPVIFMTAEPPQERAKLLRFGIAGVIAKPFDPARLAQQIGEMLASSGA